ncbi:eukaryotic translation initiation factor 4E transporter isoform X1 [Megalops cyprinoides]|uniref:eukaryotic translation initiation factor 4E transporter isoform X1 n=1 Tax=Megalops cyprinoides TaxID=118141 RepID=UPI0018648354|nr:eukaryotic translation initiation factor 4E transporter isoform X1 [Megalops cyprinoides]XP_036382500.1 eukaryotic translation initiation factor 4E transporter isoform X1 [Megalops cyprinoides]
MDKGDCVEEKENGDAVTELIKEVTSPYRYTKEELLEIKEYPCSNERPECLSEKYDSDGVWDPEKWHASLYPSSERSSPVEGCKKEYPDERVPLKRRIADPRERLKEDDLDVVLSPQRRSFGGGCQGSVVPVLPARQAGSPLENKENESLRLGGARRIGSGRIIAGRGFERDARGDKDVRERDRERDFKDKRFRRDFGDKRVFSERRRNDSYAEEEPEWFSGGPTSQSETIELIGFDDKILEEDKRRTKRSRKRSESVKEAIECNGGLAEEPELSRQTAVDQEVPQGEVLPESAAGDFDFNEFFNLEKTMPGLASMIEDVLGEGPVSASRFSRWFSSNASPSGSRSSSLRSTPHEELERLAGLDPRSISPSHSLAPYFTPIQSVERKDKVDILELLHKAKIDLKPLLSSLSVNKERLRESSHSGVVLSLEEVEVGLKGLKVEAEQEQHGGGTPFMAEHLEEALTGRGSSGPHPRDSDMSAFNKLVNTMKASGTLPIHPKASQQQPPHSPLVPLSEAQVPSAQQKNILQEILGPQGPPRVASPALLGTLLGNTDPGPGLLRQRGPSPPLFPQRAPSPEYFPGRLQSAAVFPVGPQPMLGEQFPEIHRPLSPGPTPQQIRTHSLGVDQAALEALAFQQDLALHARQAYQPGFNKVAQDKLYRNSKTSPENPVSQSRQPRMNRSPGPGGHRADSGSPGNTVTSMLSPSFTPTSVIRKMYETKEKSRDETGGRTDSKEEMARSQEESSSSPCSFLEGVDGNGSPAGGMKTSFPRSSCSTPLSGQARHSKDPDRPRPSSSGHHTPTLVSPGSASPFPRPIYPVPLLSHVPLVRPAPPQLHPSIMQRMMAQGLQPQQLPPALLQAGLFPQGMDLSQLQGLPPALLGQPFYPIGAPGHPLLPPRAGTPMQLAVMQQQLQQRPMVHTSVPGPPSTLSQSHGPHRTTVSQRRGGSPPLGLAKWFGSDVLQQPLPSMPAKVISVDELEFRQ